MKKNNIEYYINEIKKLIKDNEFLLENIYGTKITIKYLANKTDVTICPSYGNKFPGHEYRDYFFNLYIKKYGRSSINYSYSKLKNIINCLKYLQNVIYFEKMRVFL